MAGFLKKQPGEDLSISFMLLPAFCGKPLKFCVVAFGC